jgi:hypothetical protein
MQWTDEEHRGFENAMKAYGRGQWKSISHKVGHAHPPAGEEPREGVLQKAYEERIGLV